MINDDGVFADALGNNPMVGATVACAVLVEEALKAWFKAKYRDFD